MAKLCEMYIPYVYFCPLTESRTLVVSKAIMIFDLAGLFQGYVFKDGLLLAHKRRISFFKCSELTRCCGQPWWPFLLCFSRLDSVSTFRSDLLRIASSFPVLLRALTRLSKITSDFAGYPDRPFPVSYADQLVLERNRKLGLADSRRHSFPSTRNSFELGMPPTLTCRSRVGRRLERQPYYQKTPTVCQDLSLKDN